MEQFIKIKNCDIIIKIPIIFIQFGAPLKPFLTQAVVMPYPTFCHVNQSGLYTRHIAAILKRSKFICVWCGHGFYLETLQNQYSC